MGSPFNTTTSTAADEVPATESQLNYLRSLMQRKAVLLGLAYGEATTKLEAWLPTLSKSGASVHIDKAKTELAGLEEERNVQLAKDAVVTARTAMAPVGIDAVPAGRYAIETTEGATNALAFYKVDRPETGKWAGRVFVKLMVSDEEQRLSQKQGYAILGKIAAVGAAEASARYGHEIGECGICGRTLTNDESRERGIGPVCAAKNGW
jgi:hypothetical protein